jgi:hypothetical protein
MDTTEILRLIATRAPFISGEAAKALRVGNVHPQRLSIIAMHALRDPEADWTTEERAALAALIVPDDDTRSRMFPMRFTESEYVQARERADRETGGNLAELIRRLVLES